MKRSQYFYCYNKELFTFLKDETSVEYITIARNINTGNVFSMFYKDEELQNALDAYKLSRENNMRKLDI